MTPDDAMLGMWKIEEMEVWARDAFELLGPAFFEFEEGGWGRFRFIAVTGDMDCRVSTRDGRPFVEFSWRGHDELEPAGGRGWASADGDELRGRIYIHGGDDSAFTARRTSVEPATPPDDRPAVSLDALVDEVEGLMFDWRACVNTKTGEVASYSEDASLGSESDDDEDYEGPEWLHVPYPDADTDWRTMRDFASSQVDDEVRDALWRALEGRKPFGTFRAEVRARGLGDAWHAYEHVERERQLRSWLRDSDIPIAEEAPST